VSFPNFWTVASDQPDRLALVESDERRVTSGELLARVNQLSRGLRRLGLQEGDVVAAVLPNGREAIEAYLAIQQIGLYLVPINFHLVAPEIAYILSDSGAKLLLTDARFAEACAAALAELEQTGSLAPRALSVDEVRAGQPTTAPSDRRLGLVMHYTSGTTGRPKGVRRSLPGTSPEQADLRARLRAFGVTDAEDAGGKDVHLLACPWYHTAPLVMAGASVHSGHPLVIMDGFTPERTLDLIERYRVTITHLVPTQFVRLLALPEVRRRADTSSLRHVIHGAAPCSPEVKRRMIEWWGPVLDEYYASTEGVGGTVIDSREWLAKPGSVGTPRGRIDIVVLDDRGATLPAGHIGTIYSLDPDRPDFEYFKDPEKTAAARRGEYRTVGDMGYLDDDGYLYLCDRKTDMIITGGVNVYPAEVENALITHPRVVDVAVFGVPNPEWGEEIKAVVVPASDAEAGPDLTAELLAYLRARLAGFKLPRTIDYAESLPRDPSGKLYKRKLRDPYWAGVQRGI
jgi:long-chain acyl-CoA synthetase